MNLVGNVGFGINGRLLEEVRDETCVETGPQRIQMQYTILEVPGLVNRAAERSKCSSRGSSAE